VVRLVGHQDLSYALAFSPDSRLLASGAGDYTRSTDRSVRVWELATGREIRRFDWHRAGITSVAFLPDGRRLASSSADATAIIWDIATTSRAPAPSPLDLDRLWSDLGGDDASSAYRAIWTMTAASDRVLPFLAGRLKAIEVDDPNKDTTLGPIATGETLRRLRAIAVLEKIGKPEARKVLERLASGLEGARETRDARATLRRLERK
jgi:WD40 repeat protein